MFTVYSYSCGSQAKRPNHRVVICVEKTYKYPSEGMETYLAVLKMVACLACFVGEKPFHHQVLSWHWWHSRSQIWNETSFFYPVRGFAKAWMALRARNPSPSGLVTLNPQSTWHGPRPGPKLVCGVRAGSLRATEPRAWGKTSRKSKGPKNTHLYTSIYLQNRTGYKIGRDKSDLRIRRFKSLDFGPYNLTTWPVGFSNRKMASVFHHQLII